MRRAVAFLTTLGGAALPSPAALRWFPVVGAVMGGALGALWWGAGRLWPPTVAAALVVTGDLVLTGMLHLDGLVDAADGLLPPLSTERRLDVMADPAAGAFGVGAAVSMLLLRWAALASVAPSLLLLAGVWCMSRTVMVATTRVVPYARPGGMAADFLHEERTGVDALHGPPFDAVGAAGPSPAGPPAAGRGVPGKRAAGKLAAGKRGLLGAVPLGGLALSLVLAGAGRGATGLVAVLSGAAGAAGAVAFARRRVGGFTGDVLGAAGMIAETVGLLAAAARW